MQSVCDTLRAVCEEYLSRDGAKLRSAEQRRATLNRLVYPALGLHPISEIRRSDIIRLLDQIEDERGPVMANRTLAIVRRVMNWHSARSDDFRSPIVQGMTRAENARERVLNDDELRALWKATADARVFGAYVRFLLLTTARRNEAAEMRWSEIAGGEWTLPAARNKTAQDLVRPLSGAAQEVLVSLPRVCEFVFSRNGKGAMGGIAEMRAALSYASGVTWPDPSRSSQNRSITHEQGGRPLRPRRALPRACDRRSTRGLRSTRISRREAASLRSVGCVD